MLSGKSIDHPIMQPTAQHKEVVPNQPGKNWSRQKDAFSGDDVIDAYLQGKRDGKNDHVRVLLTQFDRNLKRAKLATEDIVREVYNQNFAAGQVFLKADGISNFTVLCIIKESDFLKDDFEKIYGYARKVKEGNEDDDFYISFSFMPYSKFINTNIIKADGFIFKYGPK